MRLFVAFSVGGIYVLTFSFKIWDCFGFDACIYLTMMVLRFRLLCELVLVFWGICLLRLSSLVGLCYFEWLFLGDGSQISAWFGFLI